jgi:hypothetical protein
MSAAPHVRSVTLDGDGDGGIGVRVKGRDVRSRDGLRTPDALYTMLRREFDFDHDPCPHDWKRKRAPDGLLSTWGARNFVHPPWSELTLWLRKCAEQARQGRLCVVLMPAHPHTGYWQELVVGLADEVRFLRRDLHFSELGRGVGTSMAVVIFRPGRVGTRAHGPRVVWSYGPRASGDGGAALRVTLGE